MDRAARAEKNRRKLERRRELLGELSGDERSAVSGSSRSVRHDHAKRNALYHGYQDLLSRERELQGAWVEKGSNNLAGRMHTADVDLEAGLIYAGSAGGNLWVGDLEGGNWQCHNDYLQISDIHMVRLVENGPADRLFILHSWPVELYYTDDGGLSWETATGLETIAEWGWVLRGLVLDDAQRTIYVAGVEWDYVGWHRIVTIYKSVDLGLSFTRIADYDLDGEGVDLWAPRQDSSELYLLMDSSIHRIHSDDTIELIADFEGEDPAQVSTSLLCGALGDTETRLFALYGMSSGESRVYRSLDGGLNWSYQGEVPERPFFRMSFNCSRLNPQQVYLGGVNCYRSSDGGASWSAVNQWWEYYDQMETMLHADIPGVDVFEDGQGGEFALISTDGGIYRSDDGLATVQNLSLAGLRISQYYTVYTNRQDPQAIYAGSQDQGFQRALSDPGGLVDFEQTISGDYGHIVSGDGGQSVWTVYPGFAMYYPDLLHGTQARFWDFAGSNYFWMPPLMADPEWAPAAYLGGGGTAGDARLWHLVSSGSEIIAVEGDYDFSLGQANVRLSAMAFSPLDPDHRYSLNSEGQFFHSADGGIAWTQSPAFSGPGSHYFYGASIVASPVSPGRVYIAGSGYSNPPVYVSENHGQDFLPLDAGLPSTLVYELSVRADDSLLFAATELGPYAWEAATGQWCELAGLDGPDQVFWAVDYVEALRTARFATYGRGIWDFQLDPVPGRVTDLRIGVAGPDVLLQWSPAEHAVQYRVEASMDPWFQEGTIEDLGTVEGTAFTDPGALARPARYYRVTALN